MKRIVERLRKFYAGLPLSVQIMWPITVLFGVSFLISIWLALKEVGIKKDIKLKEALKEAQTDVINCEKFAKYHLQLAYWLASSTEIRKAVEQKDRKRLLKITLPLYEILNEHAPYPLFIHFHIPPGRSFLRLWKPEKFGDDLRSIRKTIISVFNTSRPVYGFEVGRIGLAVRGIVPIYGVRKKTHVVGSVEVFCLLKDLLDYLNQENPENNGALYMPSKIKFTASLQKYEKLGTYLVIKSPSKFYEKMINQKFLDKAFLEPQIKVISNYALIGIPLKDFSSHHVAVYVRFYDLSFLTQEKFQIIKQHVIPALGFYLLALIITSMVVSQGVLSPLNRLQIEVEDISRTIGKRLRESEREIIIPITSSREIALLAKAINKLINELDDLASFRQAIEIDYNVECIYNRLAYVFTEKFNLTNFAIYEVNNSKNQMILKLVRPESLADELICQGRTFNASLCRVVRSAKDASSFRFTETCDYFSEPDANYVCLPIVTGGKVIGVIHFILPYEQGLSEKRRLIDQVWAYLQEAAPIIESKRFAQSLKEMSLRDPLTGLYNRRVLEDFLPQIEAGIRRRGTSLGVLMLDIDHFKVINDTYGHNFGDRVLSRVSSLVRNTLRQSDIPVRYGGEEFLLLLPDSTNEGAERAAERIRQKIAKEPFVSQGQTVRVTVSIGVAIFPDDDEQIERVIKFADIALYQAKARGRNCVVKFKKEFIEEIEQ